MKSWLNLWRAEWMKHRRLPLLMCLLLPLLLAILLGLSYGALSKRFPDRATWDFLTQMACAHWGLFLGNPLCIFLGAHAMLRDQPNWKTLLIQGHEPWRLLLIKGLVLQALFAIAVVVFLLGITSTGLIHGLQSPPPLDRFGLVLLTIPLAAPVLALQLWAAVGRKGILPLLVLPFFAHFVCLISLRSLWGRLMPWSYGLEFLQVRGSDSVNTPLYFLTGMALGIVLLLLGLRRFQRAAYEGRA